MNVFRLAGDMTHLASILILLLKIYATKSCSGISLKTQELYALVFLARYLDLFTNFISVYNTVMKLVFIGSSLAIVWCMRMHKMVKRSYNKELDTFRHYFLIAGCFMLALLVNEKFTFQEVLWAFSIYLEAVSMIPQLILLQRSGNVDNLTGQYVFLLGAYRALYILNWIYRYFTEPHFSRWIACVAGLVQTALYADFFYYYFISWKNNAKLQLPANGAQKLMAILITVGQAVAYVLSGMMVVSVNLVSGMPFFESIIWKAFSPTTINRGRGAEFEGAIIALLHLLITRTDKVRALHEAFYRQNLPNVTNLLATVLIFLIVVYFQGFRVVLPVRSKNARGQQGPYPIKLFYTSSMPIILHSARLQSLFHLSSKKFSGNFFVNILGKWQESEYSGQSIPVGGLAYYVTAPGSLVDMAANPFHPEYSSQKLGLKFLRFKLTEGTKPLHTYCRCIRRHVHWCLDCSGRFHGSNWLRNWDFACCYNHLSVL
ncbi:unnamed protein product [Malus baccata var. baccata]